MKPSGIRLVGGAGSCPCVGVRIVSSTSVTTTKSAPDDHFAACPDCGLPCSGRGRVSRAGWCPRVRTGIISPAGVIEEGAQTSAPDDHFAASPDCRVIRSGIGRVSRGGGCPTIGAGIVFPAGVKNSREVVSAPDYHFVASPDCRVNISCLGALVMLVAVQVSGVQPVVASDIVGSA